MSTRCHYARRTILAEVAGWAENVLDWFDVDLNLDRAWFNSGLGLVCAWFGLASSLARTWLKVGAASDRARLASGSTETRRSGSDSLANNSDKIRNWFDTGSRNVWNWVESVLELLEIASGKVSKTVLQRFETISKKLPNWFEKALWLVRAWCKPVSSELRIYVVRAMFEQNSNRVW